MLTRNLRPWLQTLAGLSLCLLTLHARAETATIAVAANFTEVAKQLRQAFEQQSTHTLKLSFGSTGKIYTQIMHGAPYDVFLSADQQRPQKLLQQDHAVADSQFTYAVGKLVLYSRDAKAQVKDGAILRNPTLKRLAMANPKTAPYGAAAQTVLNNLSLWPDLKSSIIQGDSIAQTYQFTFTGNVDAGFVALSQLAGQPNANYWLIPQDLYYPLNQDAVLLQNGEQNQAAIAFMAFLRSAQAQTLIGSFGYDTTPPPGTVSPITTAPSNSIKTGHQNR